MMDALVAAALEKVNKDVQSVLREPWKSSKTPTMDKHHQVAQAVKSVDALKSALKTIG